MKKRTAKFNSTNAEFIPSLLWFWQQDTTVFFTWLLHCEGRHVCGEFLPKKVPSLRLKGGTVEETNAGSDVKPAQKDTDQAWQLHVYDCGRKGAVRQVPTRTHTCSWCAHPFVDLTHS